MKKDEYFFEYPDFNNVKEIVYHVVEKYPKNTAFILKDKKGKEVNYIYKTFVDFLEDVNNLGTGLYNLGLKDKRIAVIGKNKYEWVLSFTTTLLGNMVVIPLDKGLTEIEIENSINKSSPDVIIFDETTKEMINNIRKNNQTEVQEFICMDKYEEYKYLYDILEEGKKIRESGNKEFENAEIDSKKASELCFTSGTSSTSKIVMLSQRNIAFDICAMHATEDFRETDVNLAFLPLHHTFGSTGVLYILSYGAATAFPDGLRYIF